MPLGAPGIVSVLSFSIFISTSACVVYTCMKSTADTKSHHNFKMASIAQYRRRKGWLLLKPNYFQKTLTKATSERLVSKEIDSK